MRMKKKTTKMTLKEMEAVIRANGLDPATMTEEELETVLPGLTKQEEQKLVTGLIMKDDKGKFIPFMVKKNPKLKGPKDPDQ